MKTLKAIYYRMKQKNAYLYFEYWHKKALANMKDMNKWLVCIDHKLRNEDDEPRWYMDIKVAFNEYYPTKICMYSGKTRKELNEDTCASLDRARIINADMTVRPRYWEVNGKSGYKAYLKVLHATIEEEDPWADAYAQYDEQ